MKSLSRLDDHPRLCVEILGHTWEGLFDRDQLAAAKELMVDNPHCPSDIEPLDKTALRVEAVFEQSLDNLIRIDIYFKFDPASREYQIETDCSCSHRSHDLCEHAAAVLMALDQHLRQRRGVPADPASGLDPAAAEWFELLHQSQSVPTAPAAKIDNRFVAYCIEPASAPFAAPSLRLHIGRHLKSGDLRIELGSRASADPIRPPKYMRTDDSLPCTLFHRHSVQADQYFNAPQHCLLEDEPGHELLIACLHTDRLFYLSPDNAEPVPIREGASLEVTPAWKVLAAGDAAPSLGLPDRATLLPTSPLFALVPPSPDDTGEALLRPVSCAGYSREVLLAWERGPSIAGLDLPALAERMSNLPVPLPSPPTVRQETLAKSRPVPCLSLFRKNPFFHRGLHLSGTPEPVVAKLQFRYHGHLAPLAESYERKLPDLKAASGEVILTIPRHKSGEMEIVETLRSALGLIPASRLDPVPPENLGLFLPDAPAKDWDLQWARIVAHELPALQEQGWEIEVDTSAEIELHAIGPDALDTGLTELPDHGIDWFRFDPGYLTPGGEKHSLLPLLTDYLSRIDPLAIPESLDTVSDSEQTVLKDPATGRFVSIHTRRLLALAKSIFDLFGYSSPDQPLHRIQAAELADSLDLDHDETQKSLAALGRSLKSVAGLPQRRPPKKLTATLRDYQCDGFRWMQFLARHSLHGILADDMGLGKTLQALAHLQAEVSGRRTGKQPSLVVAPTSVVGNWASEARKFAPHLKVLVLHGADRHERFQQIPTHHLVLTSYALLPRDFDELAGHSFHLLILDEAQYIKNPVSKVSQLVCRLAARHRLALSGTPFENHLGELWSQMRFLMPGLLGARDQFRKTFRTPIEKHQDPAAQSMLNHRVAPLILRRTKGQVAAELPSKTEIVHKVALDPKQVDLYETVRASMDKRVRDAIADRGLAKSHIIVLDALLKLRQICCHPRLLKLPAAKDVQHSAKFTFLTDELLPTLLEEGRRILLFSSFTSLLALIEEHLVANEISFSKIIGRTTKRQKEIDRFQEGEVPIFLISLKAGGTGLNLTAADTVIHYDPWWNPAAENQATDRAHRIGQKNPVFIHKLIAEGTIEERIQHLQSRKAALVEALLTDDTNRLQIDQDTLANLLAPLPEAGARSNV